MRVVSAAIAAATLISTPGFAAPSAADTHTDTQNAPPMQMDRKNHDPMANRSMSGMSMSGMQMTSSIDLNDPMNRESSGTAWVSDSTPMYGKMYMLGSDMIMLHGAITPRYTQVGSDRGGAKLDAPNWFMGMFSHPLSANSQLGVRLMMSLDPLT